MPGPKKHSLNAQKLAYARSRCQARFRAEPWSDEFTFEVWWQIWQPFWSQRGTQADCLIMVRRDTQLPWHQDNVEIWLRRDWLRTCGVINTGRRWRQWRETGQGTIGNWRRTG